MNPQFRKWVTLTFVLGIVSALALLIQYLALCDIARTPTSTADWYVAGVCMTVIGAFTLSSLITLGRLLRRSGPR